MSLASDATVISERAGVVITAVRRRDGGVFLHCGSACVPLDAGELQRVVDFARQDDRPAAVSPAKAKFGTIVRYEISK